ncbi:hypothetical protein E3N88_05699 [Mikania micrantha]|uniref:Retrotransposon Copia-like N-terminal domain-containing protein n=1 Tax=Mikania micrantha TaxID=192012 RepID=A0A5N6PLP4_9ASTR|nr:hypothetical protein E3N88_05699 [Mikania micrantha]
MAMISAFTTAEKTSHNSHKFAFKLTPTNYGLWKNMIHPFLITNHLFGYADGTIRCPPSRVAATTETASMDNPSYSTWLANDAHVRMIIISTISESSFQHVQVETSRDLWLALERAYAPHNSSREYTLKTQLLKLEMKSDETSVAYLTRAQQYAIGTIWPTDHDFMINKKPPNPLQAYSAVAPPTGLTSPSAGLLPLPHPNSALTMLQQQAALLGYQLSPVINQAIQQRQAYFSSRSQNNSRNNRCGNYRGNSRGTNTRGRDEHRGSNTQNRNSLFAWASTQNTVYGHCNRCGIGHIPAHCPTQSTSARESPQANYAAFAENGSTSGSLWKPDTGANGHATPDLASLDNSEAYFGNNSLHVGDGRVYTYHPTHGPK